MAKGDTKTNQYLDIAANGTRADLPTDTCCETRSQTLIREVAERIMDVEDEVEEIKNNPDVVDIVPTYAALQNYDTSSLTDKDIIRVLQDETHDGDSTYYRYNAQSGTWTYVGESKQYEDFVGTDGTAGGQNGLVPAPVATDAGKFLNANGSWEEVQAGGFTELTTADYNYPTNNPDGVALWTLDPGIYTRSSSVKVYLSTSRVVDTQYQEFIITPAESSGGAPVMGIVYLSHVNPIMYYAVVNTNGVEIGSPVTLLTSNTISQSTGTSTTSVMSQSATTSMVFADPSIKQKVQIGEGARTTGTYSVAIGKSAQATKDIAVALGSNTAATGDNAIAIGQASIARAKGSIAIGRSAEATTQGTVVFNMADNFGYNNTQYMLITGLYDGQNDHDAATVGQITPLTGSAAPTTDTVGTLGKIYIDTSTATAYMCVAADAATPSYTWKQITA